MKFEDLLKNETLCSNIILAYQKPESIFAVAKIFDIGYKLIRQLLKYKKIPEHSKATLKKIKLKKFTETCQNKFNGTSPFASVEVMNKVKATNITKYGVEYPMENSNICSKMQQTFIDKYGVSSPAQIKEIKDSIKINNLQKYGVENVMQVEAVKNKMKQTNLQKYGCSCSVQNENIKKKAIATLELKYGVDNPSKSKVILEKSYKTKRENHSFNISKPENDLYRKLVALFGQENIIRQYNTKIYENSDRYPFNCDFYIKPFDIFIELNLNWTHNDHRFNTDNEKDIAILNYWKAKHSKFYDKAIEVWTIRDVLKFETAEKNKLNYVVLYIADNIDSFLNKLLLKVNNEG